MIYELPLTRDCDIVKNLYCFQVKGLGREGGSLLINADDKFNLLDYFYK